MRHTLTWFTVGSLVGWLLLAAISYFRADQAGLLTSSMACLICFVPTLFSLWLALWGANRAGADQIMAVFGGMGLRMVLVLGLGLGLFLLVPWLREGKERVYIYWGNILVSYLYSLGLETFLVMRHRRLSDRAPAAPEVRN